MKALSARIYRENSNSVYQLTTEKRRRCVVGTVRELTKDANGFLYYYPFGSWSADLASEEGNCTVARLNRVHEAAMHEFHARFPDVYKVEGGV